MKNKDTIRFIIRGFADTEEKRRRCLIALEKYSKINHQDKYGMRASCIIYDLYICDVACYRTKTAWIAYCTKK